VKPYRAVLFDLYYTLLVDGGTGTREKAIEVAAAAGVPTDDWLRGWRATSEAAQVGAIPTMVARVRRALAEAGLGRPDSGLVDDLTGLLLARQVPTLYPDVRGALAETRRRGYKAGLISNLHANEAYWIREFELDQCFDALVLSCEVGMMKPDREIYLLAAERLSVSPEECVFVDDVPPYVAGAKAVGMAAVRINRFGSEEPYLQYGSPQTAPDLSIKNLAELLDWLPETAGE